VVTQLIEWSELPLVLKVIDVQKTLSINRADAYRLTHRSDFPALRIGRSIRIPRDGFIRWVNAQAGVVGESD